MNAAERIVISASRRTDIPAFYMEDFMRQIYRGFFEVINPYSQKTSEVPAGPQHVHTIVFWSKYFKHFLDNNYGDALRNMGYHLFFHFTLNSENCLLEPGIPPRDERLEQMKRLSARFGSQCMAWRFDPICFYRTTPDLLENNLSDFQIIAEAASRCGITRCVTSFMDHYPKIKHRIRKLPGFSFHDPPLPQKVKLILDMEKFLQNLGIQLKLCCEKEVLAALPETSGVGPSSCMSNDVFMEIYGGCLSTKPDVGQRQKQGCRCQTSIDIGNYRTQPCSHNCLFCYANSS